MRGAPIRSSRAVPAKKPQRKPERRESSIERGFVNKLKRQQTGAKTRKMNGLGFRAWPDRLVLKLCVLTPLWIEFKKPGETSTDDQREIQKFLRDLGHAVYECTAVQQAWAIYEKHWDKFA